MGGRQSAASNLVAVSARSYRTRALTFRGPRRAVPVGRQAKSVGDELKQPLAVGKAAKSVTVACANALTDGEGADGGTNKNAAYWDGMQEMEAEMIDGRAGGSGWRS